MSLASDRNIIGLFLPEGILGYFDVLEVKDFPEHVEVYLTEKNIHPGGIPK